MMYNYTLADMKRTQIYLDDDIYEILKIESKLKKKKISSLIRDALNEKYIGRNEKSDIIGNLCGIWKEKPGEPEHLTDKMRRSKS